MQILGFPIEPQYKTILPGFVESHHPTIWCVIIKPLLQPKVNIK